MVRFLHTADLHLGAGFAGRSRAGELRKARVEALATVLALAKTHSADFVVIAGDLFDSNRVAQALVYEAKEALRKSERPVYILPGNHDPLLGDSVYTSRVELRNMPEHVRVLDRATPIEAPGATLYPCPCFSKSSSSDPTAWIPDRRDEHGIRIGIAHGSWQVMPDLPKDDHPLPLLAAEQRGLDYLALGHWHSTHPSDVLDVSRRTFYSGTPETLSFSEENSGNVLLVSIEAPGAPPHVKKISSGRISWVSMPVELRDEASVNSLRARLYSMREPECILARLRLSGLVAADVRQSVTSLIDEARPRFFEVESDVSNLMTSLGPASAVALPSRLMQSAWDRLLAYAEGCEHSPPPEWSFSSRFRRATELVGKYGDTEQRVPPEVARRALEILYSLAVKHAPETTSAAPRPQATRGGGKE